MNPPLLPGRGGPGLAGVRLPGGGWPGLAGRRVLLVVVLVLLAGCAGPGRGAGAVPSRSVPSPSVPSPSVPRVVTFGDSVPAGTACGCTPFPDLFAARLGGTSDDLAEAGFTSLDVRNQLATPQARSAVRTATVVLVMAGANDIAAAFDAAGGGSYAKPATRVQRNIAAVVAAVHTLRPTAAVLIFGYWNVVEDGDVGRAHYGDDGVAEAATATRYCDDALRRAAAGATYVDTTAAVRGGSGSGDPTGLLAADGDHPNAAGHAAIAAAAYAALPHG
jgi:acyl-CoA thioesterase I